MIQIKVTKKNNIVTCITLKGHAKYADYGKDIVCAGVSSILTTTVNAIFKFSDDTIKVIEGSMVEIHVLQEDEITSKLLENMIELFYELEETYPKNITIREDEKE